MSRLADAIARANGTATGPKETPPDAPPILEPPVTDRVDAAAPEAPAAGAADVPEPAQAARPETGPLGVFHDFARPLRHKLVASSAIDPSAVEQYRRLGATLHQIQLERGSRVLMIASAVVGEGKTLTATNLALTLSGSYQRRVLLIDADLRRPALHTIFQTPNTHGLGDTLRATDQQRLSVAQISPTLSLVTGGRPDPDPVSGLTSARMRRVIDEARTLFDWVIIDTPPVGLLTDAKLLADMTDAILLVIRAGRTPYTLARSAIQQLGASRIIGAMLNDVNGDTLGDYTAYHDYYTSAAARGQIE